MKIKIGLMGSAETERPTSNELRRSAVALGQAVASRNAILLTGGTTGLVYIVGKAAQDAGAFHVGISPGSSETEHVERYKLPTDACDLLIFTGFGLKGRNVVLVRSCDVVLFIGGAMGSLNEFTIAHDEGKVIGCLIGTGGVADEADYLLEKFSKRTGACVVKNDNADRLLDECLAKLSKRTDEGLHRMI